MKYLKKFSTESDYNDYINSAIADLPNVSLVSGTNTVHYKNITDYSKMYLTFEATSAGTVTVSEIYENYEKQLSYSIDDGATWNSITTSTTAYTIATLAVGEKVIVKGVNASFYQNVFEGTAYRKIYGNAMSILYGDNFKGQTTLDPVGRNLSGIFQNSRVVDAENLILPATTLTDYCYSNMFDRCQSLEKAPTVLPATTLASGCYSSMFGNNALLATAPVLPATTLVLNCYNQMFYNCNALNYVKAMFTTTPSQKTTDWLVGCAATGTFVKNANATWDVTGDSGIPTGWTVETATE